MKINNLLEGITAASSPENATNSAPKMGRSDKFLEDEQLGETSAGATGAGSVASVSSPVGGMQRRAKGSIFSGIKTSEKFPNSQAVKEGDEFSTFSALKDWQVWNVHVYNNYYRGKYADYGPRLYSVVASSPDEARQVVINNAEYVLKDLLSRKLQSGKKVLPRGSALPVEEKRVGKAEPGSITTVGFKEMLTPEGPMNLKFSNGKIVASEEQGVAEGSEQPVSFKEMIDIVDQHYPKFYAELSASDISDKQFERQIISAYRKIMQKQGVAEASWDKEGSWSKQMKRQQKQAEKRMTTDRKTGKQYDPDQEFDKLKNSPEFQAQMKRMAAKENAQQEKEVTENSMADFFAKAAQEKFPHALVRKNGETLQEPPKREVPPPAPQAPVDVEKLKVVLANLEKKYAELGGDSWQYADRMMDRDYEAQAVGREINRLKDQISKAGQQLDEKSKSKAQFRMMAAVANNPEFAKKVGIKQSVGKEFHKADKGADYKSLPSKVDEAEISEDMLAHDLYKDFQIFKKGVNKDIGSKAKDKDISSKAKDTEIIAKVTKASK